MKKPVCRWTVVFLVMSSMSWTSAVQAFFCFSMGGGSRNREAHYPVPPPYGVFDLPSLRYARPVMPQPPLTPIAPIETPNADYPEQPASVPKQHIFH
jgi:hypothetical protein